MRKLKSEKGAITMVTLITIIFMVSFLISSYVLVANKVKTQKEMLSETKAIYEPKLSMEEIYNSYFTNGNIIPIYTVEELLKIGSDENHTINGKSYTYSYSANYLLMNDLEFNAIDERLEDDWLAPYENENFSGNFDWNGHTIKVTDLTGTTITYDGKYLVTVNTSENSKVLTNAVKSNLVNLKIEGNSVQNGEPSPSTPVEIQSVGDKTRNLFNKSIKPIYTNVNGMIFSEVDRGIKIESNRDYDKSYFISSTYIIGNVNDFVGKRLTISMDYSSSGQKGRFIMYTTNESGSNNNYLAGKNGIENGSSYISTSITITQEMADNTDYPYIGVVLYFQSGEATNMGDYVIYDNLRIYEGAYTSDTIPDYEPYGKYKIPIKVVNSKNLCGGSNVIIGSVINDATTGEILSNKSYNTLYMKVNAGEIYTFTGFTNSKGETLRGIFYDADENKISHFDSNTVTVPDNAKYVARSFSVDIEQVQVEEGRTATAYEPYNGQTYNIYLDEPLRKVGNYADYIDFENKKLFRRVEVLDDTGTKTIQESCEGLATVKEISMELPNIQLFKGTNTITVETTVAPSNMTIKYNAKQ